MIQASAAGPECEGAGLPGGEAVNLSELEAQYLLYCKAMRLLVGDGVSLNKARRTVCWQRLEVLHHRLPRQYRDPEQLYLHLKRAQPPRS
jgi:hypothetical protein